VLLLHFQFKYLPHPACKQFCECHPSSYRKWNSVSQINWFQHCRKYFNPTVPPLVGYFTKNTQSFSSLECNATYCLVWAFGVVSIWKMLKHFKDFQRRRLRHSNRNLDRQINPLTTKDPYIGRTASLTSKRCILYIYSTNIGTEYFKHGLYSPFFSLQNAVCFIILTYLVPVLFTFYIQGVLKLKKNNFIYLFNKYRY